MHWLNYLLCFSQIVKTIVCVSVGGYGVSVDKRGLQEIDAAALFSSFGAAAANSTTC